MMRGFEFWVLIVVMGTGVVFLTFTGWSLPDLAFPLHRESVTMMTTHRKLKEITNNSGGDKKNRSLGNVKLDDYHNIDPVPSSKASIKNGPIEHGTPLMPYIPHPTPPAPSRPKRGGSP